jgi:serine protease Do
VGRFPEQLPPIQNFIASQPVGSTLALTVKRGPRTMTFAVGTEELESTVGEEQAFEAWGLSVRKVSRTYARENRLADAVGVLVIGVRPGFPADVAGLTAGDVVTTINRRPVDSLDVIKAAHAAYEARPEPVLFEAARDRRAALFILKP